jgi:two-component system, sensor histidine kinase and response regulator
VDMTVSSSRKVTRELEQYQSRILVVEDNPVNQKVAQGMLRKFGISAELAANGEEAITSLEQFPFDLVFMDCQMPIMDGFEATQLIRDSKSSVRDRTVPIIAMTANAMQGDRDRCIEAGMNDHIPKPIDLALLRKALAKYLG